MEYLTTVTDTGIVRQDIFSDNFKTDTVSLSFFIPLEKAFASNTALLCAVLKRGNARYGEMDKISAFLETNYGAAFSISTSKAGEMQEFSISVKFLDDRFAIDNEPVADNMISLLYSTVFEPMLENGGFVESFVTQEKQNLKDRILSLINDKRVYSLEKCKQLMFENEKYGIYEQGDIEEIDKITPVSLYNFYKELIANAKLYISYGGVKRDTEKLFKPLVEKLDKNVRTLPKTLVCDKVLEVKYHTEEMSVAQSKLNIGFRLGKGAMEDPFAFKMFNVIFGKSPTSKLFMNVREKLSLCYYCASMADTLKNVMFVYSGIETENYEKARDEILCQLDLMKKGDITEEEFDNAKAYLIDSYVQAGDSLSALITMQTAADIHGSDLTPDEQIQKVKEVTPERVVAVAQNIALDTVYLLKGVGGDANED